MNRIFKNSLLLLSLSLTTTPLRAGEEFTVDAAGNPINARSTHHERAAEMDGSLSILMEEINLCLENARMARREGMSFNDSGAETLGQKIGNYLEKVFPEKLAEMHCWNSLMPVMAPPLFLRPFIEFLINKDNPAAMQLKIEGVKKNWYGFKKNKEIDQIQPLLARLKVIDGEAVDEMAFENSRKSFYEKISAEDISHQIDKLEGDDVPEEEIRTYIDQLVIAGSQEAFSFKYKYLCNGRYGYEKSKDVQVAFIEEQISKGNQRAIMVKWQELLKGGDTYEENEDMAFAFFQKYIATGDIKHACEVIMELVLDLQFITHFRFMPDPKKLRIFKRALTEITDLRLLIPLMMMGIYDTKGNIAVDRLENVKEYIQSRLVSSHVF